LDYRPSDLAVLDVRHIKVLESSIEINNWKGKTDKDLSGINTTITKASDPNLCPVRCLQAYLEKTKEERVIIGTNLVFLSQDNVGTLGAQRIGNITTDCLVAAGIEETTARSFRKTRASAAINQGADPDLIMKLGRWQSPGVFMKHFVDWDQGIQSWVSPMKANS